MMIHRPSNITASGSVAEREMALSNARLSKSFTPHHLEERGFSSSFIQCYFFLRDISIEQNTASAML